MNGMMKKVFGLSLVLVSARMMADTQAFASFSNQGKKRTQEIELSNVQLSGNAKASVGTSQEPKSLIEAKKEDVKREKTLVKFFASMRTAARSKWNTATKSVGSFFANLWTTVSSWISKTYVSGRDSFKNLRMIQYFKGKKASQPVVCVDPVVQQ